MEKVYGAPGATLILIYHDENVGEYPEMVIKCHTKHSTVCVSYIISTWT